MNYQEVSAKIKSGVGGEENIQDVMHCATRLRLDLKDKGKADAAVLKQIDGVIDVIDKGGHLQIVIGPDVPKLFVHFSQWHKDDSSSAKGKESLFNRFVDMITSIFSPILPVICGAGMLKALLAVLSITGALSDSGETYLVLDTISDAAFFFIPMLLAFTSARRFGVNPGLALAIAGILLHPNISNLFNDGTLQISFAGIPVMLSMYQTTVLPIIISVWFMSKIQKPIIKYIPKTIAFFINPMILIFVTGFVALTVFGPLGMMVGYGLAQGLDFLSMHLGWLVTCLLGALVMIIIMGGLHFGFFPVVMTTIAAAGVDTMLMPALLAANTAMGAATLAVALRTKNRELKTIAGSTGLTALIGISEPAMYGVALKLKRPFIAVMLGGAAGGLYAGFTGVGATVFASPSLIALPIFFNTGWLNPVIIVCIAFVVAFVATLILGFEDPKTE